MQDQDIYWAVARAWNNVTTARTLLGDSKWVGADRSLDIAAHELNILMTVLYTPGTYGPLSTQRPSGLPASDGRNPGTFAEGADESAVFGSGEQRRKGQDGQDGED